MGFICLLCFTIHYKSFEHKGAFHNKASKSEVILGIRETKYLAGRNDWKFRSASCPDVNWEVNLSPCKVGEDFTCTNGQCISIFKRCNKNFDCLDKTDEENCSSFKLLSTYSKEVPPENLMAGDKHRSTDIAVQIDVYTINSIKAFSDIIEITYEMTMAWIDPRVIYRNIHNDNTSKQETNIPNMASMLWTPFSKMMHKNSVLGTVQHDEQSTFSSVEVDYKPSPPNWSDSFEDVNVDGKHGELKQRMRIKGNYECSFELFIYPFDSQLCPFKLTFKSINDMVISLTKRNHTITYHGPSIVGDFEILGWKIEGIMHIYIELKER